jgi:hypothetical protein
VRELTGAAVAVDTGAALAAGATPELPVLAAARGWTWTVRTRRLWITCTCAEAARGTGSLLLPRTARSPATAPAANRAIPTLALFSQLDLMQPIISRRAEPGVSRR